MDRFDLNQWKGFAEACSSPVSSTSIDEMVIDSRRIGTKNGLFVALKGDQVDGHDYVEHAAKEGAKFAIVSEDFVLKQPNAKICLLKVKNPLLAMHEIVACYRTTLKAKVIAITGSFGKTMVKDLLAQFLQTQYKTTASPESFNSQIGVPLSILRMTRQDEFGIIEAGISQKGEMDALVRLIKPDSIVLTPYGKKHLASFGSVEQLEQELAKLVNETSPGGWALLPFEGGFASQETVLKRFFWDQDHLNLPRLEPKKGGKYQIFYPDQTTFSGNVTMGETHFYNLLNMTVKAAWLCGVSSINMSSVLMEYKPEPMRTEIWKTSIGSTIINTPYCSDPQSVDQALSYFQQANPNDRKIFVFSGLREDSVHPSIDYKKIGKTLSDSALRYIFLIGHKPFKPLYDEVEAHSPHTEIVAFENYAEAFPFLVKHVKENDLVIFKGEHKLPLDDLIENFNESSSHNQCTINLAAIHENLELIKHRLPEKTRVMVMVKALAYGTDDVRMAKFLANEGIDILGVSYVDEAVLLKKAGVRQSIFSLHAAPYEVAKAVKWDIEFGVSNAEFLDLVSAEAQRQQKKVKVHLHINTGMGRFGCEPNQAPGLAEKIARDPHLILEGIMTHFSCAENPSEDAFTFEQVEKFDCAVAQIKQAGVSFQWVHAQNSSAAIRFHFPQYNMVRLGLSIYGLHASNNLMNDIDLRLALSLTSRIVAINECKNGDSVSYGRRYRATEKNQRIAVLPIGYYDGLHRCYSESCHVLIRGKKAKMVGNICMDYMMINVTDIPEAVVGDKVLIYGEDESGYYLSPEELAINGNSIPHELMTCLGPRIPRVFVFDESKTLIR